MKMREHLIDAMPTARAGYWQSEQSQRDTTRIYAAIISSNLVLPAIAPVIVAFILHSSTLLILGFIFLIGFGTPYYILLHLILKEDIASANDSERCLKTRARPIGARPAGDLHELRWKHAPGA